MQIIFQQIFDPVNGNLIGTSKPGVRNWSLITECNLVSYSEYLFWHFRQKSNWRV